MTKEKIPDSLKRHGKGTLWSTIYASPLVGAVAYLMTQGGALPATQNDIADLEKKIETVESQEDGYVKITSALSTQFNHISTQLDDLDRKLFHHDHEKGHAVALEKIQTNREYIDAVNKKVEEMRR